MAPRVLEGRSDEELSSKLLAARSPVPVPRSCVRPATRASPGFAGGRRPGVARPAPSSRRSWARLAAAPGAEVDDETAPSVLGGEHDDRGPPGGRVVVVSRRPGRRWVRRRPGRRSWRVARRGRRRRRCPVVGGCAVVGGVVGSTVGGGCSGWVGGGSSPGVPPRRPCVVVVSSGGTSVSSWAAGHAGQRPEGREGAHSRHCAARHDADTRSLPPLVAVRGPTPDGARAYPCAAATGTARGGGRRGRRSLR